MTAKLAAGVWFLFTLVMLGGLLAELSDPRPHILFLAAVLVTVTAWLGYRMLRGPTYTIAVIAACVSAFFVLFLIMAVLQRSLTPFPQGVAAIGLAVIGGVASLRSPASRASVDPAA